MEAEQKVSKDESYLLILYSLDDKSKGNTLHPLDTGRKMNVHERRSEDV